MFLRQSTASQEVLLGPFLDDTDGKTAETALSIANTDIKIWKHGATSEASKNSGGATHIASGRYYAVLDATDTNTVGNLEINVHVSGALPVKVRLVVLEEAIYDAVYAASATGLLPANVTQANGAPVSTDTSGVFDVNLLTITPGAITEDTLAAGALTASHFASGAFDAVWTVTTRAITDKAGFALSGTITTFDTLWTNLRKWLRLIVRKDSAIASDYAAELTDINTNTGTGSGTFAPGTDSLEAARDNVGDADSGSVTGDILALQSLLGGISDNVDTAVSQGGTILARLGAWTGSGLNTVLGAFRALMAKASSLTPTDISTGTTYDNANDSLEAIRDGGGGGGSGFIVPQESLYTAYRGSTDQTVFITVMSATGPESELVAADLTAYYAHPRDSEVEITLSDLAAVNDPHSDGGIIELTQFPAKYRVDVPDSPYLGTRPFFNVVLKKAGAYVGSARIEIKEKVDGKTEPEALQIIAATTAGKLSGAGTGAETFKGLDGTTTRVVVNADEDGNRTTVTYS